MRPEVIANQILTAAGIKDVVSNLYEGSKGANLLLTYWRQTAEEVLVSAAPEWARKTLELTLVSTEDDEEDTFIQWKFKYARPSECLMPSMVVQKGQRQFWRPQYIPFEYTEAFIFTNASDAGLVCVTLVLDTEVWDPPFVNLFIRAMVGKLPQEARNADSNRPDRDNQQSAGRDRSAA